jgi:hypothetical protein
MGSLKYTKTYEVLGYMTLDYTLQTGLRFTQPRLKCGVALRSSVRLAILGIVV